MARGLADFIEIVGFTACSQAFLGSGCGAVGDGYLSGIKVFELHHPGTGEHQRRIIRRYQQIAAFYSVAAFLEEIQVQCADFISGQCFLSGSCAIARVNERAYSSKNRGIDARWRSGRTRIRLAACD